MAARRQALRFPWVVCGLGLGLTAISLTWIVLPEPDFDGTAPARAHMVSSFGTLLNEAMAGLEQFVESGRAHGPETARPESPPLPPIDIGQQLGLDLTGLREALPYYKAGDLTQGDAQAARVTDPIVRTALEWVALRNSRDAGQDRFHAFLTAHPDWPARDFLVRRIETGFYQNHSDPVLIDNFFATRQPQTALGKLAEARALRGQGKDAEAQALVRDVWRHSDLLASLEAHVRSEFGAYLSAADYKARADRLLYEEDNAGGLRNAVLAGPDEVVLARLLAATNDDATTDAMFDAVPPDLRHDPAFLYARIHKLRHEDKIVQAAALMLAAPRDPAVLIDGDAWWIERRLLARKLLDAGDPATAYEICNEQAAESNETRIDAEFHTGWIALRFLNDPVRAAHHFGIAAALAQTPMSVARIAYWQGRAAEISQTDDADLRANAFYEKAAGKAATYYGQLARARLGLRTIALRNLATPAPPRLQRDEAVRIVELFFAIGEKDLAMALASSAADHLTSEAQIAALAEVVAARHDAHDSLIIGKVLAQRGIPIDTLAFPTYGIPAYTPIENSAPPAIVYAIARQESAFDAHAVSSAGARGLMQMILSTAKRTAERVKMDFDAGRLLSDAAFSAKLGAAHLGQLFTEQRGSPILVFASYNAGGRHVKEWIDAYGDPRTPGVDPIDWVERIPFTETRNYVQRVMENWAMYRASFAALDSAKAETTKSAIAKADATKIAPKTDVALDDAAKP
ncbi:MAG: lytic transglycosylase domain-containing protein [Methylovirgula sp.]